ncbi:ABC transporter ATP-binding protein [Aliikangiella coralliicola]|uniref:ABC transporter ATP-binding protein n=1 Tax=Aliikangiella coralliicola TaxID=2592383 RepID=A0A545UBT1_9GAMM|nr:ABC transporter ATP-binding protein [Aliikangiella coralliicola]TQV86925.1 ABC transporter ATP-binding protein [Aliikangiella coralliicola]
MMTTPIISIANLSKSYQNNLVLNSLSWDIEQGDIVALLGKNGAGKSTLLETIMNLRNGDQGELKLWDKHWEQLDQPTREKIGFVAQDIKGFEWMRVSDFLSYIGGFFPTWNKDYCEQLQSRWNLDPKKRVGDLSGGQSQILHVIQALSIKPELLILDEPVAHLDPSMRRQFLSELIELTCELNSTVVFSSHIVSDLERVANKVALLQNGIIDYYYDVEQLKSSIAHVKISADIPIEQTPLFTEFVNWRPLTNGATASVVRPLESSIENIAAQSNTNIETTPLSLEDWYLEVSHAAG